MMATTAAFTSATDAEAAGRELGETIRARLEGDADAVIVFASARFEYEALLRALDAACRPGVLVGSSSAGELTQSERGVGTACALGIRSDHMRFAGGLAPEVGADPAAAARALASSFRGLESREPPHRCALVLTDALAGHADDLVEQLTLLTSGEYQFVGGGAGDDGHFSRTHVFFGTRAVSNAAVALEILSTKPIGVGVAHGWEPASDPHRVTSIEGTCLMTLDGMPAIEAFEQHAERTGRPFDRADPMPFFLHSVLGIETPSGFRLRVPLAITSNGGIALAAEIPPGAVVRIMRATSESSIDAAEQATRTAVGRLGGHAPAAGVFMDCVATRLRLGGAFGDEIDRVSSALGGAQLVGCNTYGQIARSEGQFGGFHNCTAVVLALPR